MKTIKVLTILFIATLASCSSVRVNADYDKKANFDSYKTYAYLKSGVDKAEISDLDKKRILYAIDDVMSSKGFSKSDQPDVLISIFTKERERVDVYQNYGFGWGWNPYWGANYSTVSTTPEGTLFIDIIDARTKELVWQGEGTGYLTTNTEKKEERIKEFVSKILAQYPPTIKK
ncbi:DUF4136 domain-containing protein [Flavobacterium sp. U410]